MRAVTHDNRAGFVDPGKTAMKEHELGLGIVVPRFSRHKDVRLLQRYDDNRQDPGGAVARWLAEDAQKAS
jgi:hypothetical protein